VLDDAELFAEKEGADQDTSIGFGTATENALIFGRSADGHGSLFVEPVKAPYPHVVRIAIGQQDVVYKELRGDGRGIKVSHTSFRNNAGGQDVIDVFHTTNVCVETVGIKATQNSIIGDNERQVSSPPHVLSICRNIGITSVQITLQFLWFLPYAEGIA